MLDLGGLEDAISVDRCKGLAVDVFEVWELFSGVSECGCSRKVME